MHLEDVLKINGELLCKEGKTIDKNKVLVSFKEWLDSQGLGFGGALEYYYTNDENQARFDISHDCAKFRNQQTEIKVSKEWYRNLVIKRLKENNIEVTEDNISNYKGKLFYNSEEELEWKRDLLHAILNEFITA